MRKSGFLNIAKPPGMTSHDVVDRVRRRVPRKTKVGHLGTLDPAAGGVLPIAVGSATKLIPMLPDLGSSMKSYLAHIQLGVTTSTDDLEGEILSRDESDRARLLTSDDIEAELSHFRGDFLQVPPQVSAVRQDGVRAYEKARRGESFELKARPTVVEQLKLLDYDPQTAQLRAFMVCGSGTYVRSVARDLGAALGTGGALAFLLRTHSGPFVLAETVSLEELMVSSLEDHLLPSWFPFAHLQRVSGSSVLEQKGQKLTGTFAQTGLMLARNGLVRVSPEDPGVAVVEALFDEVCQPWD